MLRARSPSSLTRSLDASRSPLLPPPSRHQPARAVAVRLMHAPHHRTAPCVDRVRSSHLPTPSVALPACVLYPAAAALHVARRYSSVRSETRPLPQRRHRYAQYARGHLFAPRQRELPHPPSSPQVQQPPVRVHSTHGLTAPSTTGRGAQEHRFAPSRYTNTFSTAVFRESPPLISHPPVHGAQRAP